MRNRLARTALDALATTRPVGASGGWWRGLGGGGGGGGGGGLFPCTHIGKLRQFHIPNLGKRPTITDYSE